MFPTQTGLQYGGSGHILFHGIEILLMMTLANTVAKTKTDQYGFLHKLLNILLFAHVKYHEVLLYLLLYSILNARLHNSNH
jgi:hypothetical protein